MMKSIKTKLIILLSTLLIFSVLSSLIITHWIVEDMQMNKVLEMVRQAEQMVDHLIEEENLQQAALYYSLQEKQNWTSLVNPNESRPYFGNAAEQWPTASAKAFMLSANLIDNFDPKIKELTHADISFIVNNKIMGSSLSQPEQKELMKALQTRLLKPEEQQFVWLPTLFNDLQANAINPKFAPTDSFLDIGTHVVKVKTLKNFTGETVGLIVIQHSLKNLKSVLLNIRYLMIVHGVAVFFVTIVVGFFFTLKMVINPITRLKYAASQLAHGQLDQPLDVSRKDELGHLAQSFVEIKDSMNCKISDLNALNQAYENFVPREFLDLLHKESIVEVKLGDYTRLNMSILFSDIRSFTSLSENMEPQDNFNFINSYLKQVEPIFKEHNGFIDKYIGDAIMALFGNNADDAVCAAIDMQRKIYVYNQGRFRAGYSPIQVGIGINTGELMLGTIGGENRMESTVISDAVNLASRTERLTKVYGVSTLITNHTFLSLKDPLEYKIRFIDRLQVRGKKEPVCIYEVYDSDPPEIQKKKRATNSIFEEGWLLFQEQSYDWAKRRFQECIKQNASDLVAQVYVNRCKQEMLI